MKAWHVLSVVALTVLAAAGLGAFRPQTDVQAKDLDSLLDRMPTASRPSSRPEPARAANPFARQAELNFSRPDALPAAAVLSDGTLLAGGLYTTTGKDLEVWVEAEKRWRHVPLLLIRGIRAEVVSEGLDPEWRWKELGSDEKVYTGRTRPIRRLNWRMNLIDGSSLAGEVKGQPLWIERDGKRVLWILHARTKGRYGQELSDLVYPKHIVISRREMMRIAEMIEKAEKAEPTSKPTAKIISR